MNENFSKALLLSIMMLLSILSGCGGGGGDAGSGQTVSAPQGTPSATPQSSAANVTVKVDSAVPRQAAQKIDNFASVAGSTDMTGQLPLPAAGENVDHLVLGSNGNKPFLLGFSSGNINLSSETTAIALVRIALGGIRPTDIKVNELDALIKNAAGYPTLVQNINSQLANGVAPIESKSVIESTWTAANEVGTALRTFNSTIRSRVTKADSPPTPKSLPYDIIASGPRDKVWLDDPVGNDVTLKNRTMLSWAATYKLSNGTPVTSLIDGRQESYGQLLGYYGDTESSTNFNIPASQFNFVLSQKRVGTADPVTTNGLRLTQRLIVLLLGNLPGLDPLATQCIINVGTTTFNDKLPAFLMQPTIDAAKEYAVNGLGLNSPTEFATFLFNNYISCSKNGAINAEVFKAFFAQISGVIKYLYLTRDVFNSFDMLTQYYKYYNAEYPVDVCQNTSNVSGAQGDCGIGGFFMGTAEMNSCIGAGGGIDYCNFLTYNLNKPEIATLSFRIGNEPLNVRVDQAFGCIGASSTITQQAGSSFSYALSSEVPQLNPSVLTFRVDFANDQEMSGGIVVKYQIKNPDSTWSERTATGKWSAKKSSKPFPKCLLPIPQATPTAFDPPPFFCSTSPNVQRGCSFLPLSAPARKDEWLTQSPTAQ